MSWAKWSYKHLLKNVPTSKFSKFYFSKSSNLACFLDMYVLFLENWIPHGNGNALVRVITEHLTRVDLKMYRFETKKLRRIKANATEGDR